MRRLRVTFPMNLNDKDEALRGEVYWEEFKNIDIDKFEYAIGKAINSLSFFPKPIELHEFIWEKNEIEYREKNRGDLIEYKECEDFVSPERGKEILYAIQKIMISKAEKLKPSLEGKEAKEFEEKRKKAKKLADKIMA